MINFNLPQQPLSGTGQSIPAKNTFPVNFQGGQSVAHTLTICFCLLKVKRARSRSRNTFPRLTGLKKQRKFISENPIYKYRDKDSQGMELFSAIPVSLITTKKKKSKQKRKPFWQPPPHPNAPVLLNTMRPINHSNWRKT